MAAATPILGTVLGGLGLYNQIQGSNRQQSLEQQALATQNALAAPQIAALNQLFNLASGYNPVQEARAGIGQATPVFEQALQTALGNVGSQFAQAGSAPGSSSEFGVRSSDIANRVSDPFREYLAQVESNPTQMKMNAFADVLRNAPSGNLASGYLNMAQQYGQQYGPSLGALGGGLDKLFGPGGLFHSGGSSNAAQQGQGQGAFPGMQGYGSTDPAVFGNIGLPGDTQNPDGSYGSFSQAAMPTFGNPSANAQPNAGRQYSIF